MTEPLRHLKVHIYKKLIIFHTFTLPKNGRKGYFVLFYKQTIIIMQINDSIEGT